MNQGSTSAPVAPVAPEAPTMPRVSILIKCPEVKASTPRLFQTSVRGDRNNLSVSQIDDEVRSTIWLEPGQAVFIMNVVEHGRIVTDLKAFPNDERYVSLCPNDKMIHVEIRNKPLLSHSFVPEFENIRITQ